MKVGKGARAFRPERFDGRADDRRPPHVLPATAARAAVATSPVTTA